MDLGVPPPFFRPATRFVLLVLPPLLILAPFLNLTFFDPAFLLLDDPARFNIPFIRFTDPARLDLDGFKPPFFRFAFPPFFLVEPAFFFFFVTLLTGDLLRLRRRRRRGWSTSWRASRFFTVNARLMSLGTPIFAPPNWPFIRFQPVFNPFCNNWRPSSLWAASFIDFPSANCFNKSLPY